MCYHVEVYLNKKELERYYEIESEEKTYDWDIPAFHLSGFAFPKLPIIINEEKRSILVAQWGLIPSWIKDEEAAKSIRMKTLNARAESLDQKPSYQSSFRSRRCLFPCTGFYEWQTKGKQKIPHYIHLQSGEPFSIAGIYDQWLNEHTGELIDTFSLITVEANPLMAEIHNSKKRMPAILPNNIMYDWIDNSFPSEKLQSMLKPYQDDMEAYTISKIITSGGNANVAEVKTPFNYNPQQNLFG